MSGREGERTRQTTTERKEETKTDRQTEEECVCIRTYLSLYLYNTVWLYPLTV